MSTIVRLFPVEDLATVNYLLEEDATTVGFVPLRDPAISAETSLYTDDKGHLKPRLTDPGVERHHPNVEMLARIRDIVLCALTLHTQESAPIVLNGENSKFVFTKVPPTPHPSGPPPSSSAPTSPMSAHLNLAESDAHKPDESVAASDSHQSMDNDMHRMVDSLLEPSTGKSSSSNETSYGMHSLTANEVFAPIGSNGHAAAHHSTPKILPSLPFLSSPFTPKPNELQPTSPDRPSTARQLSPFQLTNPQRQLAAATALDEMTGYRSSRDSWGRKNSRPFTNPSSQPVHQILQDSLAQQFGPMAMSSFAFSDSSSIYANTPRTAHRYNSAALRSGPLASDGNNTTTYAGASEFDRTAMLQSSLWASSQPARTGFSQTPPGGQGG